MTRTARPNSLLRPVATALAVVACALLLAGCAIGRLVGGMSQNYEYQKQVEVLPQYDDLANRTVAVVVTADMALQYENPTLVPKIADGVARRIERDVANTRVLPSGTVVAWQYRTPQWEALPYGEIARQLNVDRVVFVDVYEYRLNPPGNSWEWEGVAAANVGIIERDGLITDDFAEDFHVVSNFPNEKYITRENANRQTIEFGLLADFIKRTAWLFHTHLEPKYPDKYRPQPQERS